MINSTNEIMFMISLFYVIMLLFSKHFSSVRFSESISAAKYPSYGNYQAEVNRLIPWIPKKVTKTN